MAGKGSLGELALGVSRARSAKRSGVVSKSGDDDCPTIVEYVEAPWGLGQTMYPVQRVILKAYYGIPLNNKVRNVRITNWRKQEEQTFTEAGYLAWLYDQGRSNIREVVPGDHRRDLVLAVGRRSGKCILGSSLVLTDRGVLKIADLAPDSPLLPDQSSPLTVTVAQEGDGRALSSHFYNGGVKTAREFTTRLGFRLGGTDNHRVKVLYPEGDVRWKYLADIQEGDVIALAIGTNLWASGVDSPQNWDFLEVTKQREVPQQVLQSACQGVRDFLQGLLGERESVTVRYRTFAAQVQVLLLNMGVISRITLEQGAWGLQVEHPQCSGDYFFDPVVGISEKQEQVWDLTVPEGHSFVANGMVNHNTEMAAWITSYEIFKLLRKSDPQGYYGIPSGDEIKLCAVATGRDQAGELYAKAKHYFLECNLFDPYRANMTTTYSRFQTQKDIEEHGRHGEEEVTQATIKATFYSCIAKGLRGAGNIVVVLDEIAHFVSSGQSSGAEVYKAVTPSIAAFSPKDPKNRSEPIGPTEGRVVLISSPMGRDGFFYQKFRQGFDRPEAMLCVQASTWEVNPSISAEDLEVFYTDDPVSFFTEFGAEFSDRTRGWLEREEDLVACIDPSLIRLARAPARMPHFMGIDIGVTKGGDGTAVAIGHIDSNGKIVLDYLEWIRAGEGKYKDLFRLDFDDIASWLAELSKKFHITEGIMDRWAGLPMEQALHKKGLRQIISQSFTQKETTFMYKTFKDMMWDSKLRLYNWEPSESGGGGELLSAEKGDFCGYLEELLELQEEKINRYISKIEAPQTKDKHDDRSDALIRMVWLASQKLGNSKFLSGGPSGSSTYGKQPQGVGTRLSALRRARLGGSHPSRQRPGISGYKDPFR